MTDRLSQKQAADDFVMGKIGFEDLQKAAPISGDQVLTDAFVAANSDCASLSELLSFAGLTPNELANLTEEQCVKLNLAIQQHTSHLSWDAFIIAATSSDL